MSSSVEIPGLSPLQRHEATCSAARVAAATPAAAATAGTSAVRRRPNGGVIDDKVRNRRSLRQLRENRRRRHGHGHSSGEREPWPTRRTLPAPDLSCGTTVPANLQASPGQSSPTATRATKMQTATEIGGQVDMALSQPP